MKVADLVQKLKDLDPGMEVLCYTEDEGLLAKKSLFRLLDIESVEVSEAERLRVDGPQLGDRTRAADRLFQDDHRLRPGGQQLRGLPRGALSRPAVGESAVRSHRTESHLRPRGVLPIPRRLCRGPALQLIDAAMHNSQQAMQAVTADVGTCLDCTA